MRKMIFLIFCIVCFMQTSYANEINQTAENNNVMIVKNMFSDFAEKLDINKLDTFYTNAFE